MSHPLRRFARAAYAAVLIVSLAACGDPFALPPAGLPTNERVVVLYAMTGTPIPQPSAFNAVSGLEVRVDRSPDFDFAVDFVPDSAYGLGGTTGDSVYALIPAGALGFGKDAGLILITTMSYDSLKLAPEAGYTLDHAVRIDTGAVVVVSSRAQTCNFGLSRHLYAKVRIDGIDPAQRKVSTTILTDPNCGYRGLTAGVPQH